MTTIKVDKDTATILALLAKGQNTTVERLILTALNKAFKDEMRAVRVITKPRTTEQDNTEGE